MRRLPRPVVNAFIALVAVTFALDAPPATCRPHRWLQQKIAPVAGVLALDQSWPLYAPHPDHANTQWCARVSFTDGTESTWESPRWDTVSSARRLFKMRHVNAWSSLVEDDRSAAWPGVADFHAREAERASPGKRARRVDLIRRVQIIPPPSPSAWQAPRGPTIFTREETFFAKDY